jgi:serpin B
MLRTTSTFLLSLLCACGAANDRPPPLPPVPRPPPTSAQGDLFSRSANGLGLDLWARLRSSAGDQVFSPASIAVALDMTYAGARGATASEMAAVLHIDPSLDAALHDAAGNTLASWNDPSREAYTLTVANRLFGERRFEFERPFLDLTAQTYGAPLELLDFRRDPEGSRVHINGWVEAQTNERIRDLVPPDAIRSNTRLVLTNAVYFHAKWARPFAQHATYEEPFFAGERTVQARTMHQRGAFQYAEVDGAQVLEMPYRGGELAMTVVLPRERNGLAALEAELTSEKLASFTGALAPRHVEISIPKFRIEPSEAISLSDHLRALGMPSAFDPDRANFRGMAPVNEQQDVLYISDVFHKAFIAVDEEGTEAAAATAVVMAETTSVSIEPEAVAFDADHPFLFFIRDVRSGAILFMGRLADPT